MLIRDFIRKRGPVMTCHAEDSIADAADKLAQNVIGVMPVIDKSSYKLVGMLSERDVVRAFSKNKSSFAMMSVNEVMTRKVVSCAPGNSFVDAANLMRHNRIRHLPIVDDELLVGLISVRDMLEVFGPTDKQGMLVSPASASSR